MAMDTKEAFLDHKHTWVKQIYQSVCLSTAQGVVISPHIVKFHNAQLCFQSNHYVQSEKMYGERKKNQHFKISETNDEVAVLPLTINIITRAHAY